MFEKKHFYYRILAPNSILKFPTFVLFCRDAPHMCTLLSVIRTKKKTSTLNVYGSTEELLCVQMIFHSMQDVVQSPKLCLNNIWGKFAQTPDITIKEFITEPRRFYHLHSDDGFEVSDVHHVNYDCLYVSYKKLKGFQTPALNTNCFLFNDTRQA